MAGLAGLLGTGVVVQAVTGAIPVPGSGAGNGGGQGTVPNGQALEKAFADLGRNPSLIDNGCADVTSYHICVPSMTFDGRTIPPLMLLQRVLSSVTSPNAPSTSPGDPRVIAGAEASVALDEMLDAEAPNDGVSVNQADATALAEQELALYEKDPADFQASGVVIPAGSTPADYFTSPAMISAYQQALTIGKEKELVRDAAAPGTDHRAALIGWMKQRLARHSVELNGTPASSSLADQLPPQP